MANVPAKIPARIPRGRLDAIKQALVAAGLWEVVEAGISNSEEWLSGVYHSITDSGGNPEDIPKMRSGESRKLMLVEMARSGVVLDKTAGLSRAELNAYNKMLTEFGQKLSEEHDGSQVERPSSGIAEIDNALYYKAMSSACARLALSGASRFRELYQIAQVLNTVREADVQGAELFELNFPNALKV